MKRISCVRSFLCFFIITLVFGCGGDETVNKNFAPVISVFEAESEVVLPGTHVPIRLKVNDLENDILSYAWSATYGEIEGDATGALWIAPETERKYQIQVSVSDGEKTTTSTLDIHVWKGRPGNYYPLAVGNIWRYRSTEDTHITWEIIDTIQIQQEGGKTVESFVLQKINSAKGLENVSNYSYLGNTFDEDGKVSAVVQHAQNITSGTEDTMIFAPFLPLYKFPLYPSQKWKVNYNANLVDDLGLIPLGGGVDEFDVSFEGTVTVPAGSFENVFQVQESFHWVFNAENQNFPLDTTVVQKWLAPDVGIIKFTQEQTRGDVTVQTDFELESYELVKGIN